MHRVYTASKVKHHRMWNAACLRRNDVFFHARWLKHMRIGTDESPESCERFWQENIYDVITADALVCYAEPRDELSGALVEIGAALAARVPVWLVGDCERFATWQHHPLVKRCDWLDQALDQIAAIRPAHRVDRAA